jgi:hypothetical protein
MQNMLARVFHSRQTEKEGSMNESESFKMVGALTGFVNLNDLW